ncbi:MAG TPA: hypothetical protein VFI22_14670 [Thermomicrobiales bacterium]|nr:hypothetical protein [Thermomicrobiales bacterium]
MVRVRQRLIAVTATLALAALGCIGSQGVVRAQDATPVAGMSQMAGLPNHIHNGTCAALGEIVVPLAPLTHPGAGAMGGAMASPMAGMAMATPMASATMGKEILVLAGVTKAPMSLNDILASPHAIQIHNAQDLTKYLACGDLVGTPTDQGDLFVGLGEQNGSGLSGIAWLHDDGSGSGTTVTVMVAEFGSHVEGMGGAMATPSA